MSSEDPCYQLTLTCTNRPRQGTRVAGCVLTEALWKGEHHDIIPCTSGVTPHQQIDLQPSQALSETAKSRRIK